MNVVLALLICLAVASVLIGIYNKVVIHGAKSDEAWNRYSVVMRIIDTGEVVESTSLYGEDDDFRNLSRARVWRDKMERHRVKYVLTNWSWSAQVAKQFEYVVFDHKTGEVI